MKKKPFGVAYDAVHLLGFGSASTEPLLKPVPGEIVIRVGDWSLQQLRDSDIGKVLMHQQDWYNEYPFSTVKLISGIYRVRLPVPDSNFKNSIEQKKLLLPDEAFAKAVLGATTLMCGLKDANHDLLKGDWCRFCDLLPGGGRAGLGVDEGRVDVDSYGNDVRDGSLWFASSRLVIPRKV